MGRSVNDPLREYGRWNYLAGTDGTVNITSSLTARTRIVGISAASSAGGSVTINGGDAIPVPAGSSITVAPKGNLRGATVIFDTTITYMVETVDDTDEDGT